MRAFPLLLLIAACGPSPKTSPEAGEGTSELLADPELGAFIAERMEKAHLPGLAAAIVYDGEVQAVGAWGLANVEDDVPVTVDTLFNLASVSKTVTGTALMQAIEDGLLDLGDDVNDVLPFEVVHPDTNKAITPKMLMTHTSGIIDNWDVLDELYVEGDSPIALGDFLEDYLVEGGKYYDDWENWGEYPGDEHDYTNVGASLAGYVVEAASGTPFDTWTQRRIFEPLGMDESGWHLADLNTDHIAIPYGWYDGAWESYGFYGYPDYPDGNLRTSAPQIARFLAAFTAGGVYDGERILDADSVEAMLDPQVPDLDETQGLIWYSWTLGDEEVWGHNGGDDGVTTEILFRKRDGVGVVLLANGDGDRWSPIEEIEEELFALADD